MTRDEFMREARKTAGKILESKENGIMNLVQQAWAEGKRNAEVETLSELINEALAKDNNVHRKLAYWVEETDRERHWHCSNCGRVQGVASVSMKYCPECGYEMIEHPWAASGCGQTFCPGKDE